MEEHINHEVHQVHHEGSLTKKARTNPWMIATIVLAILVLILLIINFTGAGITGKVISKDEAGKIILDFAEKQTGEKVELSEVTEEFGMYKVTIIYKGEDVPLYLTKDGENLVQGVTPLAILTATPDGAEETPQEVVKSDKPIIESFIFSYCPYGLQFEKALLPVYDLLKGKADIGIVAIGAMHGEFEKLESFRQLCVEKIYGRDKLFSYLKSFDESTEIGKCSGDAVCLKPLINEIYSDLKIDESDVNDCMDKDAQALYDEQGARASELGISGSPTFVINGAKVQVARTPSAIKEAICNAFTTAPAECSQNISSSSVSAGFGASASTSGSSASCG